MTDQKLKYEEIDSLKYDTVTSRLTDSTLEKLLAALQISRKNQKIKILDIGCGPGFWAEFVSEKNKNIKIIGIDLLADCFDDRIAKKHKNIRFQKADALKLPFKENEFDFVYSFDVIEHFPKEKDVDKYLSEAFRVLKPGGKVIIQTPNKNRLSMRIKEIFGKRKWPYLLGQHKVLGEILHYREYTKEYLEKVVKEVGFVNLKTELLWLGPTSPGNGNWGFKKYPSFLGPLAQLLFLVAEKPDKINL